jgi:hypothetical protein
MAIYPICPLKLSSRRRGLSNRPTPWKAAKTGRKKQNSKINSQYKRNPTPKSTSSYLTPPTIKNAI